MAYLLDLIYAALLLLASPWLLYQALAKGKYSAGWSAKLLGRVPRREGDATCVWLHAVSVGEVNLLRTLIDELAQRRPEWQCVLSTTTLTGYALARTRYPQLQIFYCPLDFSWAVRNAVRRVRPDLLVLAELELWPNLIRAARSSGARVAVVNGRLSERSFAGYRRLGRWMAWLLEPIDCIAVQNEEYAQRFRALGAPPERIAVTGSLKYDGAECDRDNLATQRLRRQAGFAPDDIVFLAGSTQEPEERLALETYLALADETPQLRLVLVPRHPERFETVARLLAARGVRFQRRSELDRCPPDGDSRVLLVDTVGELGAWWGSASIAFVGGSLGQRGGQNMIEPAAYGAAVAFGPNTHNFRDIVAALLEHGGAEVVADGEQLTAFVRRCLADPAYAQQLGRRAQALVRSQLGATRRTADLLLEQIERGCPVHRCAA